MELFLQQTVTGLGSGAIYASLALALVFIFRSTNIVNFSQGEMAMFATYFAWQLTRWGIPLWAAFLITLAASFVGGAVIERVIIRPVERAPELTIVIVTLGLLIALNSLAGWVWSFIIRDFPSLFPQETITLGAVRFGIDSLGIVAILVGVVAGLFLLFQRTKLGLAMRAAASNPESSRLVGIRVTRMIMLGWALAAALGALAGMLVAPSLFLEPTMMLTVMIYAFASATLGGFDSPVGAVAGGLTFGVTETLVGTYIPFIGADLKVVVALLVIFAVLLVRPTGLFGSERVVRV